MSKREKMQQEEPQKIDAGKSDLRHVSLRPGLCYSMPMNGAPRSGGLHAAV
jgi:hypothetical protein